MTTSAIHRSGNTPPTIATTAVAAAALVLSVVLPLTLRGTTVIERSVRATTTTSVTPASGPALLRQSHGG